MMLEAVMEVVVDVKTTKEVKLAKDVKIVREVIVFFLSKCRTVTVATLWYYHIYP